MRSLMKCMVATAATAFTMVIAAGLIAASNSEVSFQAVQVPRQDSTAPKVDTTPAEKVAIETEVPAVEESVKVQDLVEEVARLEKALVKATAKLQEWKDYRIAMESFLHRKGIKIQGEDDRTDSTTTQIASHFGSDQLRDDYCPDCQKNVGGSRSRRGR